jgi:hypothetical protein
MNNEHYDNTVDVISLQSFATKITKAVSNELMMLMMEDGSSF